MICRADARGLAVQSESAARALKPQRLLIVDMHQFSPYPCNPARYEGFEHRVVRFGEITQDDADWLMDACDVILMFETPYSDVIILRARQRGVATLIQHNHEFFSWATDPTRPKPDMFLAPSTWHFQQDALAVSPTPCVLLEVPVERDRVPFRRREQAKTFLFPGGHPAAGDRNGGDLVALALQRVTADVEIIVASQQRLQPRFRKRQRPNVTMNFEQGRANYWEIYDRADVLVFPRRYGGLALPINEALSCGMPVISLDVEPQRGFLPADGLVPARAQHKMRTQCGLVDSYMCDPPALAARIDLFANSPDLIARLSDKADQWATAHSWEAMRGQYESAFARALAHA